VTLGELLTKLGYDHVSPQPSLVNAVLVVEDPLANEREQFPLDLGTHTVRPEDNKPVIILHFG
jgi:hypothetical protein